MKRFAFLFQFFFLLPVVLSAQISMSIVGEAILDEEDLDAASYYQQSDANDHKCAILKVHLNNPVSGRLILNTRGGMAPVEPPEGATNKQEDGDWWFWLSDLTKNIMFTCEGYTPTEYRAVALTSGKVYRINLNVASTQRVYSEFALSSSAIKLNVSPLRATVSWGKTQSYDSGVREIEDGYFDQFLDQGTWFYKVESEFYESVAGQYDVNADSREVSVVLKPAFNYLQVSSEPEGAEVLLDGDRLGVTPLQTGMVGRGKHILRLHKEDYYLEEVSVSVGSDGALQEVPPVILRPQFGLVTCVCEDPEADLVITNPSGEVIQRGKSGMKVRLNSQSSYKLEASRPSHKSQSQGIMGNSVEGKDVSISVGAPIPLYGGLELSSNPTRAEVLVDGQAVGTTSYSGRILIGNHRIELRLDGYYLEPFAIDVLEGQTIKLEKTLMKGPREVYVTVSTSPEARLLIDGRNLSELNTWRGNLDVGKEYLLESQHVLHPDAYRSGKRRVTITAEAGQTIVVPDPEIISGQLHVTSGKLTDVRASIKSKDGSVDVTYTPPIQGEYPIGEYTVFGTKSGYHSDYQKVTILEGMVSNVDLHLRKIPWHSLEQDGFAKYFLNSYLGYVVKEGITIGLQGAYVPTHLGVYASASYGFGINRYAGFTVTGGGVIRLTEDWRKLDFQFYGGAGYVVNSFGLEAGMRLGFSCTRDYSWWDITAGAMFGFDGTIVPTVGLGLAIPLTGSVIGGLVALFVWAVSK